MSTFKVIERQVVGSSGATSITFNSIPADYTDLYVVVSGRATGSGDFRVYLKLNNTLISSSRNLYGVGASASAVTYSGGEIGFGTGASDLTANTFGSFSIYIPNYLSSNNKSISFDGVTETNATTAYSSISAGLSNVTSAITSLDIEPTAGDWVEHTSATLYGIKKYNTASAPKATGGIISFDSVNNYWYHTFTGSGTFTPTQSLTADILVVGGGGGGGGYSGGGAGGYLEQSGRGFSATGYSVTIGAGGTGGAEATGAFGVNGTNTTFDSVTALGGGAGGADRYGLDGGSGGGGASGFATGTPGSGLQGNSNGATGYGNDGGQGVTGSFRTAGGGGGAGSVGGAGNGSTIAGSGGAGKQWLNGNYYAGGGGGANQDPNGTQGSGGIGGGGRASRTESSTVSYGIPGTGGGGGGNVTSPGGSGGSGVVIVRYAA